METHLPVGAAGVSVRPKNAGRVAVELDVKKKYALHLSMADEQVCVEVVRGPNTSAFTNSWSLVNLFPGDEGTVHSSLARSYAWAEDIAKNGNANTAAQLFGLLEKRFVSQKYLSPQIDLLCQLQVHQISLSGIRLATQSKLISFGELPHQHASQFRFFVAKIEFPNVPQILTATIRISPEYPRVRPFIRLELSASSVNHSASAAVWPDWTAARMSTSVDRLPGSLPADSVLSGLESSVNAAKGPRDPNFDLSTRMAKVLLAFDLYAFSVLGQDSARSAWSLARASCVEETEE